MAKYLSAPSANEAIFFTTPTLPLALTNLHVFVFGVNWTTATWTLAALSSAVPAIVTFLRGLAFFSFPSCDAEYAKSKEVSLGGSATGGGGGASSSGIVKSMPAAESG